jgi:hypothetical protein
MNQDYGSMQSNIPRPGLPIPSGMGPSTANFAQIVAPAVVTDAKNFAAGGLPSANEGRKTDRTAAVLEHYFKNAGIPLQAGMAGVQKEVSQGLKLIPYETSVMGFKPLSQGIAQVHFFTIGSLKDLADDMRYFINHLKSTGIKVVYDTAPAPITSKVLQQMGAQIAKSDNPKYPFKAIL